MRILLLHNPRGENELGEAGEGAVDAALVASAPLAKRGFKPVFPQCAIVADAAQFPVEDLAGIVEDKADMRREHIRGELWQFPAWKVGRPAVMECQVVADG